MKFKKPQPPPSEPAPEPRTDLGIEAELRDGDHRCALCHDAILMAQAGVRCGGCGTVLHADCSRGVSTCPTLGCAQKTRGFVPLAETRRTLDRIRSESSLSMLPVWLVLSVVALVGLGYGWQTYSAWKAEHDRVAKIEQKRLVEQEAREARRDVAIARLKTLPHDTQQRMNAARTLGVFPEAARALADACLDPVQGVRATASWTLARSDGAPTGAVRLCESLESPRAQTREHAAQALAEIGAKAPASAPALVRALGDTNGNVRAWSARALWEISSTLAAPHLLRLLADSDSTVVDTARALLGQRGPLDALLAALDDPDAKIRRGAGAALSNRSDLPATHVNTLAAHLEDSDAMVLLAIANTLAEFGPKSAPAVPQLVPLLRHPNSRVRYGAVRALTEIGRGAKAALPELFRMQHEDPDYGLRSAAIRARDAIGP